MQDALSAVSAAIAATVSKLYQQLCQSYRSGDNQPGTQSDSYNDVKWAQVIEMNEDKDNERILDDAAFFLECEGFKVTEEERQRGSDMPEGKISLDDDNSNNVTPISDEEYEERISASVS